MSQIERLVEISFHAAVHAPMPGTLKEAIRVAVMKVLLDDAVRTPLQQWTKPLKELKPHNLSGAALRAVVLEEELLSAGEE